MKETVKELNKRFEKENAEDILQYLFEHYQDKVIFTTSMGVEDQIITHILSAIDKNAAIVMLDTGRMFYEVYDLVERTENRYNIRIKLCFPDFRKVEDMVNKYGINLFYESVENRRRCCHIRKIEPLRRALGGRRLWITGLRKEQSSTRKSLKIIEQDVSNDIIKVNPLLYWSVDDVWDYVHHHRVPYNPLHDRGYPSIGCQPCTRAVEPGEDIRAGRWWWEKPETKECGLHKA